MDVKYLLPHENPLINHDLNQEIEELHGKSLNELVGITWSRLLRVPMTKVGCEEKREFLEYCNKN